MPAALYDWETWFNKKKFVIQRGKHYFAGTGSMVQQVRNAAKTRGLKVNIVEGDDTLTVRVREEATPTDLPTSSQGKTAGGGKKVAAPSTSVQEKKRGKGR